MLSDNKYSDDQTIKVVFFYPSKRVGGAQYLFARIALVLSKDISITIVDYENGFIKNYLDDNNAVFKFELYKDDIICDLTASDDLLIVLPLSYLLHIPRKLNCHENCRFVFWDLHPYNLVETTALSKIYKIFIGEKSKLVLRLLQTIEKKRMKKLKEFVETGMQKYGVCFLNRLNYTLNMHFIDYPIRDSIPYLPIPIQDNVNVLRSAPKKQKDLQKYKVGLCWLGRLDSDKYFAIETLLQDISKSEYKDKVDLFVIGDGSCYEKILRLSERLKVKLVFKGILEGKDLEDFVVSNVDVGFAMGTSSLEFANMAVPSVVVPLAKRKDSKCYIWLNNVTGYDVTCELYQNERNTFDGLLEEYMSNRKETIDIGLFAKQYVEKNHSMHKTSKLLKEIIYTNEFSYDDIKKTGIWHYSWTEKILFKVKYFLKSLI